MHFSVKWFDGEKPSFNLNFHKAEGQPEFFSLKGLRLMNGQNGEFVSMPSTKNQNSGKYWNHAWADETFSAYVLTLAKKAQPRNAQGATRNNDIGDDIPFAPRKDY